MKIRPLIVVLILEVIVLAASATITITGTDINKCETAAFACGSSTLTLNSGIVAAFMFVGVVMTTGWALCVHLFRRTRK